MSNSHITAYPEPFLGGKGKDTLSETWAGDVRGVVWESFRASCWTRSRPRTLPRRSPRQ